MDYSTDISKRATTYRSKGDESEWIALSVRPPDSLSGLVHSLWFVHGHGRTVRAFLPVTGCTDVAFSFDAPLFERSASSNSFDTLSDWWIEGLHDSFIESRTSGPTTIVGFRLYPTGAYNLFGKVIASFSDHLVPGPLLKYEAFDRLHENLAEIPDLWNRLQLLEAFLVRHVGTKFLGDERIARTANKFAESAARLSIADFCRDEGISYLRLIRDFREQMGVTPKRFSRIARFRGAYKAITSNDQSNLTNLALQFGYYDQSHLIREFRQMTGCAPREFVASIDSLSQSVAVLGAAQEN